MEALTKILVMSKNLLLNKAAIKTTGVRQLKFDLRHADIDNVNAAILRLYVTHVGDPNNLNVRLPVHEFPDNWSENDITWNNQPEMGGIISSAYLDRDT